MATIKLIIALPDSSSRTTTELRGTHNNVVYTVTIARGDAVINQQIGVQTGGIYKWRISDVAASDGSGGSWAIETAWGEVRGPEFQGASGSEIGICIKPQYIVRMT